MSQLVEDPICKLLSQRIQELMPLGLHKIWFLVKGASEPELATALGYSREIFDEMIENSPLSGSAPKRYWLTIQWKQMSLDMQSVHEVLRE